jgi:triacylglycerol lipase
MTLMRHAMDYMNDKSIKDSNKVFYYFGHSLGGALATLAALVFGCMYPDARHVCITFGAPRVGDARFCDLFRENVDECVRCVN